MKKERAAIIHALILFILISCYQLYNLSPIETFVCRREMSLIGSTSFSFAQNMIHGFQNTVLNS